MTEYTIADLFAELDKRFEQIRSMGDKKAALLLLAAELGLEVHFCRLKWCGKAFVPKRPGHEYCNQQHCDEDWNKGDRRKVKKNPNPDAKRQQN